MDVFMTDEERQKVEAFKSEYKIKWEKEQQQLEEEANKSGAPFTPGVYQEVSDSDALTAVRGGWKSFLDKQFERKRKHDAARGVEWGKPFKI